MLGKMSKPGVAGTGSGFTAEDIAAAAKAGLTVEDMRKYGPDRVASPESMDNFSAEDLVVARKSGLSIEDVKKYGPKGKE